MKPSTRALVLTLALALIIPLTSTDITLRWGDISASFKITE